MIDIVKFRKRYTEALLNLTAQQKGASSVEAFRRYQTDAKYHMQVDTLVDAAVSVIETITGATPQIQQIFEDEVSLHLGWEEH